MAEDRLSLQQLLEQRARELQVAEARFRNVINRQGDGIIVTDRGGIVLFVNPAAESLFQRKAGDLIGTLFGFPVVVGDTTELDIVRPEGEQTIVEMRVVETEWETAPAYLLSLRDITDRKHAEEERARRIREQAARAEAEAVSRRLAFLNEASGMLVASLDYELTLRNVARLAVPGFADWCLVDLLDEQDGVQRLAIPPANAREEALARRVAQALPSDPASLCGPARVLGTGVSEIYGNGTFSPEIGGLHDARCHAVFRDLGVDGFLSVPLVAQGRVLGVITFVSAGTARHYGTDERLLAEDLARRASLAVVNSRLYHQILESDRRKDEFLAMLAHELRNPLSPILSALEILRIRGAQDDQSARWAMDMVERQARHMARLVDDLLDVSRITRGKVDLRREPLELSAVVNRALGTSRPLIESRRHQLELQLPETPVWIQGDLVRLEQALVNLLNNAAKYTEVGGTISVLGSVESDQAVLRVRDTGMGMTPEMCRRAFDLFTQGERTLDRSQGGLGIGLTLARSLIELHGGSITAHSDGPGQGSEFVLRLPALTELPEAAAVEADPTDVRQEDLRVLVVDDSVDAAMGMGEVLKLWGYEVRLAYDGPDAIKAAAAWKPHVVLLDIGLPRMDGYEVASSLRQRPELQRALLVAITGYGQQEDHRRSRAAGFDLHFTKPMDLPKLRRILAAHPASGLAAAGD